MQIGVKIFKLKYKTDQIRLISKEIVISQICTCRKTYITQRQYLKKSTIIYLK